MHGSGSRRGLPCHAADRGSGAGRRSIGACHDAIHRHAQCNADDVSPGRAGNGSHHRAGFARFTGFARFARFRRTRFAGVAGFAGFAGFAELTEFTSVKEFSERKERARRGPAAGRPGNAFQFVAVERRAAAAASVFRADAAGTANHD